MREMKDSGVEWIGEIPSDWKICRFKNICSIFTGNSIKDEEKEFYEDPIDAHPYIATKDIDATFCTPNYKNGLYIKNSNILFKTAPKNSTLMCIEGGSAGKKKAIINQDVSFVNKLCCIYSERQDNRFLYYYLSSPNYESEFRNNISGLIGGVSVSILKNIELVLPPLETQHRISDYLDSKCSKIDAIIKHEQTVIEKLKEYKLSVITEAVTKGFNSKVEMKDSGIEWIGNIPAHWNKIQFKYLIKSIESGVSVNAGNEPATGNQLGVLKTSAVSSQVFISIENKNVNSDEYNRVACPVERDTLIVSRMNTPELVGACGYVENDHPNLYLPDRLWKVRLNDNVCTKFFWYYLVSKYVKNYYASLATGTSSSMQNISKAQFCSLVLVVPEFEEQLEITSYLDKKCFTLDKTVSDRERAIEKLEEYKKSLIYEVVTGKKEV